MKTTKPLTGARSNFPAYEITPLGRANAELRAENERLRKQVALLIAERDGARNERNYYMTRAKP